MPTLEDALELALKAHRGQQDKSGAPYILHPLRLMLKMHTDEDRIAALLHDVVEDSAYTLADLHEMGYSQAILDAVDCLTKRDNEDYIAAMQRVKPNPIARRVKLADLEDNMDIRRLASVTEKDWQRLQRYRAAWAFLQG